jgi:putative tryptophan/tyrosine transport system substrate-binding protein
MDRRAFLGTVAGGLLATPLATGAQPADRPYQLGVVLAGGPYLAAVDGLRSGLKDLGLEEGRHFVLHVHDVKGDPNAVGPAARTLEKEKVDLIYTVTTSITLAASRATARVPIVFYAGSDPVTAGLVQSFRKPGGRLTGVYSRTVDLTPKRFELLKAMLPRLRRVVTFYRRDNAVAVRSIQAMREVARELKIELLERPVASSDELRASLRALKPGAADAYLQAGDATIVSQTDLIVDIARARSCRPCSRTRRAWPAAGWRATASTTAPPAGTRRPTSGASCSAPTPATCRWSRWTTRTSSSTSRSPRNSA